MSEIMDAYWQAPPLARTLATAILVTSLGAHFYLIPYEWLYFSEDKLWRLPPQVWRLVTSFLLSSPQLGIILDPYFAYQYLSQLEMSNPKFNRKEDLVWYLVTVGGMIVVLNRLFFGNVFFLHGLTIALCYTAVQDQRGAKQGFFFFTVPAQLVPYCMLLASLLMSPGLIPLQITGIIAAHLHDFLTRLYPKFGGGVNLLPTPAFISRLVQTPRVVQRSYGTAIRSPAQAPSSGSSTGASTGSVLPDSWRTRGTGRRLGGE
ncbi:Der1-like family-domain-containing protein [Diplogelasinospora grovesii]|uniref:Derlin n=1 Tax=Diplogelasinospora grovesii TaxID=303347 RepID=A0AAN6NHQ1_9PEZI|nr:Der1-like family-domain-containing protein [Diplogelasinospora grovesii]